VADPGETLVELWPLLPRITIAELKTVPGPYEKGNLDRLWMYCHGWYAGNHKTLERYREPTVPRTERAAPRRGSRSERAASSLHGARLLRAALADASAALRARYGNRLIPAGQPDEDPLGLYAHSAVRTPRAIKFWGELAGSEAKMEARELEGYEEAIQKILSALPPELRLAGLPPEQVLSRYAPEQRLAGLPPEQVLSRYAPEQRLAGLTAEQALLAMPVDALRALSAEYVATLSEETRTEIARRLGRS
jgi:hypothetical protein